MPIWLPFDVARFYSNIKVPKDLREVLGKEHIREALESPGDAALGDPDLDDKDVTRFLTSVSKWTFDIWMMMEGFNRRKPGSIACSAVEPLIKLNKRSLLRDGSIWDPLRCRPCL
jgi:hypothetical protein